MAGAPNGEHSRGEIDSATKARARRLALLGGIGWSALGIVLLGLAGALLYLRYQGSYEPDYQLASTPPVAAPPPSTPIVLPTNRDALPESVQRYLANTVYPPGVGQLTAAQGDLLEPNRRHEDFRPIPETFSTNPDEVVSVRLTSGRYYYEGDDPIELRLGVRQGADAIPALSLTVAATREGRAGLEGSPSPLRFDLEGDEYIGRLDPARFSDHHGPILVEARVEYQPGVFHDENLRLFITPEGRIPARFTGVVRDRIINGSLRIEIGIDVEQAGQYRIDANLYDRNGKPVAYSAFKNRLSRSDQSVPIEFFGRLLLDLKARGPFSVGEVRGYRFLDGQYPDRERIPDLSGRFPTSDYAANLFSPDEFVSEHKLHMLSLLMEDEARGIGIQPPPIATPTQTPASTPAPTPAQGEPSGPNSPAPTPTPAPTRTP